MSVAGTEGSEGVAADPFDAGALDRWSEPRTFTVEPAMIAAYAAATNDLTPESRSGTLAPPVFAIVPGWGSIGAGASIIAEDRREEIQGRVVHGEQWTDYFRPIRAGDELVVRSAAVGVHAKSSGTTVVTKIETRDAAGDPVNDQYATTFYRGVASGADAGEVAPSLGALRGKEEGQLLATITFPIDEDQPARYAQASGDHNRIHLDDGFARSVGLPGIIVHGMCTLAFASRAARLALAQPSAAAFRRLGCRFTRPLLPGDVLTTNVFLLEDAGGVQSVRFECSNGAGEAVLGAGYAELAT